MTKKHFIALADAIKEANRIEPRVFSYRQLQYLADFYANTNPHFNRERWLGYIKGECGPCGGKLKP
jgi:hypothetical protein